ncbi:MAG: hypothetical protein J7540_09235, partial [Roseofilum sp. SID2]
FRSGYSTSIVYSIFQLFTCPLILSLFRQSDKRGVSLFCHFWIKGRETLIPSLAIAGCNDGNSLEFPRVTEEGYLIATSMLP